MAKPSNQDKIAAMYVAYFNRAPDKSGLDWWGVQFDTGKSEIDISAGFASHPQFQLEYGALTSRSFVEKLYTNMLGNAGDVGGVNYWIARLDGSEKLSRSDMVADFVRGALEVDLQAMRDQLTELEYSAAKVRQDKLWNKVEAAKYFATTLDALTDLKPANETSNTLTQDMAYQASIDILKVVTENAASLVAAKAQVDTIRDSADYSSLLDNYANITKATTSQTLYNGTAGNDVLKVGYSAIKADNTLGMGTATTFNGGEGFDVLELTIDSVPAGASSSSYPVPELTDVELVRIKVTPTMQTNNTDVRIGVGKADVLVTGQTADGSKLTLVSKSTSLPNVSLLDTNADVQLTNGGSSWNSLSATARLTLDGYNAESLTFNGSIGTVDLYAYNTASSISNALSNIARLNIRGEADLVLGVNGSTLVNASTYSGDLTLWQTSSYTPGNVTLGSGSDWLKVYAMGENRLLNGGAGRDTLEMDKDEYTAIKTQGVSNFEVIQLNGSYGSGALDAQQILGVDTFWINDGYSVVEVTNVGSSQTLGLMGQASVKVLKAVDTVADVLTVAVLGLDKGSNYSSRYEGKLQADAYETINLLSSGEQGNYLQTLASTSLTQLNVTGSADLAIQSLPGTLSVNASAFTANLSLVAAVGSLTFTGGAGDDRVNMGDTLEATDVLKGGAGFDTLVVNDMRTLRSANVEKVTGFEALELTSDNTAADVGLMSGLQQVVLNGGAYDSFVVQNLAAGSELVLRDLSSVTVTGKDDTAADTLKIISYEESSYTLNALGYEKLELNTQGFSYYDSASVALGKISANTELLLSGGAGQSIIQLWDTYSSTAANLSKIDASAFAGSLDLRLSVSAYKEGLEVIGTSSSDEINLYAGRYTVSAGAGDDRLIINSVSEYSTQESQHVLSGGTGKDTFVFGNTYNNKLKATITDLDLGTSLTSVDRIDISGSYADGSSLTDAQVDVYTGGSTAALADARVLVLNNGSYANASDALLDIQYLGIAKSYLTVFWADDADTVHMSAVNDPNSTYGDIYELAALTNLTIQGVVQNLDYTDFV